MVFTPGLETMIPQPIPNRLVGLDLPLPPVVLRLYCRALNQDSHIGVVENNGEEVAQANVYECLLIT